ncbi:hypothetical protein [Hymenobacter sp. AT01-02]|uniref:hypothetical protein n=1 Tax=Hymenobacter sp. AT01-02 TaxID=1571877 RepID=UPI0005F17E59|nr:hypothetical protein [Hymenobacter sp. AT01-02]
MKYFLLTALLSASFASYAQKAPYSFQTIPLPLEIADRNNQFSGLHLYKDELLLLSESRLQERAEAKVYALNLNTLDKQLAGKAQDIAYRKYAIRGLSTIRAR